MKAPEKRKFQTRLVRWFKANRRPMPWRETNDPYKIWISETLLQQTQVATATGYYLRFISRFPDVRSLSRARLQTVLKLWEGLGYYARARNLHRAASQIVKRFNGRVPDDMEGLLSLPGIGRYTAGAVLSIAYGKPVPVLDGNVIRVLSRLFRVEDDVRRSETREALWDLAESLMPAGNCRDYNEALMELGAVVCAPRNPACPVCPVRPDCKAFAASVQEDYPRSAPRKAIPHKHVTAGIIWKNGKFLITLRPARGMLGGLWEFPGGKAEPGETLEQCLKREIREELGIEIRVLRKLVSVNHAYTHFRITLHAFECLAGAGRVRPLACDDFKWITSRELDRYPFPGADRKIIALLSRIDPPKRGTRPPEKGDPG
ncbi:MAG: A/G-specific adenine glycosylase [bacterium]|nr:A/G-specific adenine glycosylase [bacterium]